jgi:hypothetical protein
LRLQLLFEGGAYRLVELLENFEVLVGGMATLDLNQLLQDLLAVCEEPF